MIIIMHLLFLLRVHCMSECRDTTKPFHSTSSLPQGLMFNKIVCVELLTQINAEGIIVAIIILATGQFFSRFAPDLLLAYFSFGILLHVACFCMHTRAHETGSCSLSRLTNLLSTALHI